MFVSQAFAQGAGGTGGDLFAMIVPLILIMAVFWFLLIRPQQKRAKEHQELIQGIRRGDVVATTGGMIGKVARVVDDNEVCWKWPTTFACASRSRPSANCAPRASRFPPSRMRSSRNASPRQRRWRRRNSAPARNLDALLHQVEGGRHHRRRRAGHSDGIAQRAAAGHARRDAGLPALEPGDAWARSARRQPCSAGSGPGRSRGSAGAPADRRYPPDHARRAHPLFGSRAPERHHRGAHHRRGRCGAGL
jgi:preprotein translocase subunit YajC